MKTLFLFDVDGTIVKSSEKICQNMSDSINKLKTKNIEIGIVGGGKLDKILDQMDDQIYFNHYFTECGCVYAKNNSTNGFDLDNVYIKNIRQHTLYEKINILVKCCLKFLSEVDYTITGNFVDLRNCIIYISLIGMTATLKERETFINLDFKNKYRDRLIKLLKNKASELDIDRTVDIVEGGSVGIALYPSEFDKIQVLDIFSNDEYEKIYYFGDKFELNGNDYNLLNHERVIGFKVNNYEDTIQIIENLVSLT